MRSCALSIALSGVFLVGCPRDAGLSGRAEPDAQPDGNLTELSTNEGLEGIQCIIGDGKTVIDDQPLGVEECDAYLRRMEQCYIAQVQPESRESVVRQVKRQRLVWKLARADGGLASEGLPRQCKEASVRMASELADAGCLVYDPI